MLRNRLFQEGWMPLEATRCPRPLREAELIVYHETDFGRINDRVCSEAWTPRWAANFAEDSRWVVSYASRIRALRRAAQDSFFRELLQDDWRAVIDMMEEHE